MPYNNKPAYNKPGRPMNVQTGGGFPLYQKPNGKAPIPPGGKKPMGGGMTKPMGGGMPKADKKAMKMDSIQRRLTGG